MIEKTAKILLLTSMVTITASADIEDDIFKSGVDNTLKVLEYQKMLVESDEEYDGKLCYKINPKEGEVSLSDFMVIKLEALSFIAETKPIYFVDKQNKKTLCFFTASGNEAYDAKKRLIEDKFKDIKQYHPQKVTLKESDGIQPILPSLGLWNLDMKDSINTLNKEISSLNAEINQKNKLLEKAKSDIAKMANTVTKLFKEIEVQATESLKTANESIKTVNENLRATGENRKTVSEEPKKPVVDKKKPEKMLI